MVQAEQVLHAWKEWGIQALVLFSLTLQVTLLVLAEFRRCLDSGVLKVVVWSAYILADSTAIYVLGHLSVTSRSAEHQLMAFWAPFLLLHLGGQDNITAYAIEDNRLWLRHLQTLVVQVAAAGYVLYESSIISCCRSTLWWATFLMFMVGMIKYAERVWALKCAGSSLAGNNYRDYGNFLNGSIENGVTRPPVGECRDDEALLLMAHRLLDVPKDFLKGPLRSVTKYMFLRLKGPDMYKVVEMEASLMHDVFYTKAEVMHTWYGLGIRMFSLLATAVAFFLFYHNNHHQQHWEIYSRADVAVTYVLLLGALVLEVISGLRTVLSSWTVGSLVAGRYFSAGINPRKILVSRVIMFLRRHVHAANWRSRYYCSGSMGQHNLIQLCLRTRRSRSSKIARRMGVEDLWNSHAYSNSITVPTRVKKLVYEGAWALRFRPEVSDRPLQAPSLKLGSDLACECLATSENENIGRDVSTDVSTLGDDILTWHIATDIYLCWWKKKKVEGDQELFDAVQALSNYMLFLLASRPYMLPPPANRIPYIQTCYKLIHKLNYEDPQFQYSSGEDLAALLRRISTRRFKPEAFSRGCKLGKSLVKNELGPHPDRLKRISEVWAEMLCFAGHKCTVDSHAKQLSNGGELITIAALLVQHVFNEYIDRRQQPRISYDTVPYEESSLPGASEHDEGQSGVV